VTTPKINQSLSEIFDVELTETDKSSTELAIAAKVKATESLEKQRDYVRTNLVKILEQGMASLENMINIANSTEQGKDFLAVATLIKTLADTNVTLLDCEVAHKPGEEKGTRTKSDSEVGGEIIHQTAVFVGSTADLLRQSKNPTTFDSD
jgi:hypothetical protein